MKYEYAKAEKRTLRELGFDEKWLQDRINEDPGIIGLGELTIIQRERPQPTGGRIDFLLSDLEEGTRYETEIMLGRLDESHIVRSIEYWDIERTRYPHLEHRAVIVAEEITSRFFNVISILNRSVPIIAIQLNAMTAEKSVFLSFTKVLDISELYSSEDEQATTQVDRAFWDKKSNAESMSLVDEMIAIFEEASLQIRVTYNQTHIALGNSARNFLWMHPRKSASHVHMHLQMSGDERTEWVQKLENAGIFAGPRGSQMKARITKKELKANKKLVSDLLIDCYTAAKI